MLRVGLSVTKRTNPVEVKDLIQRLRPQNCGKELIRIGSPGDGGYLLPDDLAGIEYCFSPGVSDRSEFENQLADLGIKSFLADYSVDAPQVARPELIFDKKFLGASDRGNFMTLASWKDKYLKDYAGDLILQMDIEGSEYEVILNMPDSLLSQFRIIVIEFHFLHKLYEQFAFRLLSPSFEKILQSFHVVHIHPNDLGGIVKVGGIEIPKVMEFTFLNKKRVTSTTPRTAFPHPLDADNGKDVSMPLPKCWYSAS
jgi:hypothetical protein